MSAEVITVAEDSVERLIVDEPKTTRLLALPVSVRTIPDDVCSATAAASVDVLMLVVIVLPLALVVVTATVVLISVELGASDDAAEEEFAVELACAEESAVEEAAIADESVEV